jgi:hypothetical protein
VFAGLVVLNNFEFGLPALAGTTAAIMVAGEFKSGRAMRTIRSSALGLVSALVAVSMLILLLTGQLPNLGLLTFYSRIFEGGYALLHTPVAGLYLIVDMTFAAAVLVAAVRYRRGAIDVAHTAALAYSGVFGLGAGNYYMGRTQPAALVALFSIWALSVTLLALLALRALTEKRRSRRLSPLLTAGALVLLGLMTTTIAQFPAPWTQLRRIATSAPPPPPYNVSAAVSFVRRTTTPGERIVLYAPLGHLIALDAHVEDISPYSHPNEVVTYQQLDDMLAALRQAGGTRFYVSRLTFPGSWAPFPEIPRTLENEGFRSTATDLASEMTEWRR